MENRSETGRSASRNPEGKNQDLELVGPKPAVSGSLVTVVEVGALNTQAANK